MMHVCSDCRGYQFVWDNNGDVVCTTCGLVKIERYIDDRPEWGSYNAYDMCRAALLIEEDHESDQVKEAKAFLQVIENDEPLVATCIELYCIAIDKLRVIHTKHKKNIMAICIYHASCHVQRGLIPEHVMAMMQVNSADFWKESYNVSQTWTDLSYYDSLMSAVASASSAYQRLVHILESVVWLGKRKWDVIKAANILFHRIQGTHVIGRVKQSKLHPTIIYIACMVCGIKVELRELCRCLNTSVTTVKKHEAMIQDVLR